MTSRIIKILAVLVVATLASGCKVEIVSIQGGDIAWDGGSCPEGSNCVIQITDPNFTKTFTVTPKPGYQFVKWQKAPGFLCGDSTSLTCTVTLPADVNVAAAVIGVFATGYMMPVYKDVGIDTDGDGLPDRTDEDDDNDGFLDADDSCPLKGPNLDGYGCPGAPVPEAYYVGARTWANLSSFAGYSYTEIDQVCPLGVCSGLLGPYGMNGWHWATRSDIVELAAQGGCGSYFFQNFPVNASVFQWTYVTAGLSSAGMLAIGPHLNLVDPTCDVYSSSFVIGGGITYPGAWFYRDTVAPN